MSAPAVERPATAAIAEHRTDRQAAPRAKQGAAASVLAVLTTLDLPATDWNVSLIWPGTLDGHIGEHSGSEAERVADVAHWAATLKVPLSWHPFREGTAGTVQAVGVFLNVPVKIFTRVASRPEQVPAVSS